MRWKKPFLGVLPADLHMVGVGETVSLYFFVYFSYEWVDVLQVETTFTKVH